MSGDAPGGRRLPVAGSGSPGKTAGAGSEDDGSDRRPPQAPSRFWHVILPSLGALIILGAGLVGQCFGG